MDDVITHYIRQTKVSLLAGMDIDKAFSSVTDAMRRRVDEIDNLSANKQSVVPEVSWTDINNEVVSSQTIEQIRQCGCVVIRNVFSQNQAREWNEEMGNYLDQNDYASRAAAKGSMDNYFGDLASAKPQIFGIYWSRPQVMARQAESMAVTKRFLNNLWRVEGPMGDEFDPNHDLSYADRTRRRAPGDKTLGLSPHMDSGSYERWVDPAYQKIYEHVFSGNWQDYDPWRAAFRTQTREYKSPAVCSMFRTFQGWTALTPQGPGDGTLKLLPIANSIAYTLLRSLMPDIPQEQFAIARPGRALGINEKWHPDLMPGLVSIPAVEPGDTVWWHPDVIHAVENEHGGNEYASVIYIGATPVCGKNEAYARRQAEHFLNGLSAPDFAAENYEVDFTGRATVADLTELGRTQMQIPA